MVALKKPTLFVEQLGGKIQVRVQETQYRLDDPDKSVTSQDVFNPKTTNAFVLGDGQSYEFTDIDLKNTRYGYSISNTEEVNIYDLTVDGVDKTPWHSAVFTLPARGPINKPFTLQRVYADGELQPMLQTGGTYADSNKDFFDGGRSRSVQNGGDGYVFMRDITASNFSDAIIDTKDTVYIMNATIENAHRLLRVWKDSNIVIVNSIINLEDGQDLIWLYDNSSRVSYYNTLWNGKPDPDPSLIKVHVGDRKAVTASNVKKLDHNPLPEVSDFFATSMDEVSVEISVNGGAWREVNIPNTGQNGVGPIGDLLYDLPNVGDGSYKLRAYFSLDGKKGPLSDEVSYSVKNGKIDYDSVSFDQAPDDDVDAPDPDDVAPPPAPIVIADAPPPPVPPAPQPRAQAPSAATLSKAKGVSLGDGATLKAIGLDGGAGVLTQSNGGFGVKGGRYDQQADFDAKTGRGESFYVDFKGEVRDVELKLQLLTPREHGGLSETARWTAFDEDGLVVAEGRLSPETGRSLAGNSLFAFDIDAPQPFAALLVTPTGYGHGAAASVAGNNSDFQFRDVDFERVPDAPAETPRPAAVATNTKDASTTDAKVVSLGDGVTLAGVDFNGSLANLVKKNGAFGVDGGRYDTQADYDGATGKAEGFIVDFNGEVSNIEVRLKLMTRSEYKGLAETAKWTAFDAKGAVIGEGTLEPEARNWVGGDSQFKFKIDAGGPVSALHIEPTGYGHGAGANVRGNNSDFQFADVSYKRAGAEAPKAYASGDPYKDFDVHAFVDPDEIGFDVSDYAFA